MHVPKAKARTRSAEPGRGVDKARARGKDTTTKAGAALVAVDKPLTQQQRAFVKFWAQGESPLMASVKAGYADGGTYAYRMIHQPNILALYNEEKAAYERDSGMNRKRVIDGFLEAVDMAKMLGEPSTMVAGWREIAKMVGYYEPVRVQHTVTHEGKLQVEKLDRMTDAELMELIQQQALAQAQQALPAPGEHDDHDAGAEAP